MEEVETLISLLFSIALPFYVTQPFLSVSSLAAHPIISPMPLPSTSCWISDLAISLFQFFQRLVKHPRIWGDILRPEMGHETVDE